MSERFVHPYVRRLSMGFSCENYLNASGVKKFFVGDKIVIKTEDSCFRGVKITLITNKGVYFDAGTKSDKYIRADKIKTIELWRE